jgi:hypothetical protein
MSSQGQKPIDFAPEGLRLALPVDRNCGIRVHKRSTDVCCPLRGSNPLASLWKVCSSLFAAIATAESGLILAGSTRGRLAAAPRGWREFAER